MSGMPPFDGRRDRTGWVPAAPTNGWAGDVWWKITNGMCTVVLDLSKVAWGAEVMVELPPPATPVALPYSAYFEGMDRSSGNPAPCYLTAAGEIACVFGSAVTGGDGIVGTITYPVA